MKLAAASSSSTAAPAAAPARVGRPPRVNLQAIVDAALEIGLDRASIPLVAERLGVGASTLYRHVRSRDELLRLATVRLALERQLPQHADGHWSEIATQYAIGLYDSFVREPLVVQELMRGRLGPDAEVDYLEPFLAAVCRQGFTPSDGVHLFRAIGVLAVGAAVGQTAVRARAAEGETPDAGFRRALAERPAGALPHLRAALAEQVELEPREWLSVLHHLLAGLAAARGEQLPAPRGLAAADSFEESRKPGGRKTQRTRSASP